MHLATKQADLDKKSELMLMRRARAYSSSCSQVILVYLCRAALVFSQLVGRGAYVACVRTGRQTPRQSYHRPS